MCAREALIGDLPGVGLTWSGLSLSIWISMKSDSHSSSCDVNVNCAMNVLKFRLGRFQNMVRWMRQFIWDASLRNAKTTIGIMKSHCLTY